MLDSSSTMRMLCIELCGVCFALGALGFGGDRQLNHSFEPLDGLRADPDRRPGGEIRLSHSCATGTAGIGVLGQASPMIQEMFPGRVSAAAAAGFVGLLSLFNMGGRFLWSSLSDILGRKLMFARPADLALRASVRPRRRSFGRIIPEHQMVDVPAGPVREMPHQ